MGPFGDKKIRKNRTKKFEGGPYYVFQDVRLFLFFCFAQGSEISNVLNLRVLNLPQVVEQMN